MAIASLIEAFAGSLEISCFSRRGETRYVVVFRTQLYPAAFEEESTSIEGAVHQLARSLAKATTTIEKLALCLDVAKALEAE